MDKLLKNWKISLLYILLVLVEFIKNGIANPKSRIFDIKEDI